MTGPNHTTTHAQADPEEPADGGRRDAFTTCLNCSAETTETFCERCAPETGGDEADGQPADEQAADTYTVEVYQPRDPEQYLTADGTEPQPGFRAICHDLRDLAALGGFFIDEKDLDHSDFTRLYSLAGGDTIPAADEEAALQKTFEQWNNGSGWESEAFRRANQERRAASVSAGDIIRVDGTTYFCAPFGWTEVTL
jgi:hypothetical protein